MAEYTVTTQTPSANPTTQYITTDMLGSPRVISDGAGNVISRRDFLPFGEDIPNFGARTEANGYKADNVRQKFTGYQKDNETGLDFAEARYYNSTHGRFTAVDPLLTSGKSADPQTFNRYIYAMNNPLVLTDPSGMQAGHPFIGRFDVNVSEGNRITGVRYGYDKSTGYFEPRLTYDTDGLYNPNYDPIVMQAFNDFVDSDGVAFSKGVGNALKSVPNMLVDTPIVPLTPTSLNNFGVSRFFEYETTNTWRQSFFSALGNVSTSILVTGVAAGAAEAAPAAAVNTATRGLAAAVRLTSRSEGAVSFAADFSRLRFSWAVSGEPKVPKNLVNSSMNPLINEAKVNGVTGLGGPRTCCEFKAVNNLLNQGSSRENILFQVIDLKSQRSIQGCSWCQYTMRGTTPLNGNQ